MYDKGLSVLEQYGLVSENTYRGRGALICQTKEGLKLIKSFEGSVRRLEKQNQLLEHMRDAGHPHPDLALRNSEGSLVTTDKEGVTYLVKDWWDARECDAKSRGEILRGMQQLAYMHGDMYLDPEEDYQRESLSAEYDKHNQELKKVRAYIRSRNRKNNFEYRYLGSVERYLEYGIAAADRLSGSPYSAMRREAFAKGAVCHGEYNQHNILMKGEEIAAVNYDHFSFDEQTADIAQFMRKILEKHNWDEGLGMAMLEAYGKIRPLADREYYLLAVRLSYPDKFWKIVNFYYNNKKAFLSARHYEKLEHQLYQEKQWLNFVNSIFSNFLLCPDVI